MPRSLRATSVLTLKGFGVSLISRPKKERNFGNGKHAIACHPFPKFLHTPYASASIFLGLLLLVFLLLLLYAAYSDRIRGFAGKFGSRSHASLSAVYADTPNRNYKDTNAVLTVSPIRNNADYWTDLATTNYHTLGGEPPGKWLCEGAEFFGLTGKRVAKRALNNLLSGFPPEIKRIYKQAVYHKGQLQHAKTPGLVQNAGKKSRQSGYDFCFSAPKSVSVAWAAADKKTRRRIQRAHQEAVKEALTYLENIAAFTRRGTNGEVVERAQLVIAAFEHSTSRLQDPQLHTHAIISNIAVRADGTTGTLLSQVIRNEDGKVIETYNPLMRHAKAAGALYRAELAHNLQKYLGFELEKSEDGFSFRIQGISEEACSFYSKRRKAIEDQLQKTGFSSPEAAEYANYETRLKKERVNRPQLFARWEQELRLFGITPEYIQSLRGRVRERNLAQSIHEAVFQVGVSLASTQGSFTEKEWRESACNTLVAYGVSSRSIAASIEHHRKLGEVVSLGWDRQERVFSTVDNLAFENNLLLSMIRSRENTSHRRPQEVVDQVLTERAKRGDFELSPQQVKALRYLFTGDYYEKHIGALRVVLGDAGTGKTAILAEAKRAWEKVGYRVVGATLAGRAADNMEMSTRVQNEPGIPTYTIAKWNWELSKNPLLDKVQHHATQAVRDIQGKRTHERDDSFRLDSKTVLVIDETAMSDSDKLYRLQIKAEEAGALICWIGDEKQCQAIGHGGAFVQASRLVDTIRLTENFRQRDSYDVEAARLQAEGKSAEALRNLAERGRVYVERSEELAIDRLVEDWNARGGGRNPKAHQVYCGTHKQRLTLNEKLQAARQSLVNRMLGGFVTNHEGQKLFAGDRVYFKETLSFTQEHNSLAKQAMREMKFAVNQVAGTKVVDPFGTPKRETVRRGAFGTVVSINPLTRAIRVSMDDGRLLDVPLFKKERSNRRLFPTPPGLRKSRQTEISLGYATTTHAGQGSTFDHVYSLVGGNMQDKEISYVQLTRARFQTCLYTSEEVAGQELALTSQLHDAKASGDSELEQHLKHKLSRIYMTPEESIERSRLARQMRQSRQKDFALRWIKEAEPDRQQGQEHSL